MYITNSGMGALAIGCCLLFSSIGVASQENEPAVTEVEAALHLTPDLESGKEAFQICAVCHLPEGWGTLDGRYPQVAGQLPGVVIKQLADIRAQNRDNPLMRPFASPQMLGGAQEIADVAAYISSLPMNPLNGVGPGTDLVLGEKLYKENCVDCHGGNGEGDEKDHIPLLQGQHYYYLKRQFDLIRLNRRRNADPKMVRQIKRFTSRDVSAVMDYVSRLRPPEEKLAEPNWRNPDFPNHVRIPVGGMPPRQPANR